MESLKKYRRRLDPALDRPKTTPPSFEPGVDTPPAESGEPQADRPATQGEISEALHDFKYAFEFGPVGSPEYLEALRRRKEKS